MDRSQDSLRLLDGKRLLIVEEDFLAADDVCSTLRDLGATVVRSAPGVEAGITVLELQTVDGAILDIRLDEANVFLLVERLQERGIPFVFASTLSHSDGHTLYGGYLLCKTPNELRDIATALFDPARAGH